MRTYSPEKNAEPVTLRHRVQWQSSKGPAGLVNSKRIAPHRQLPWIISVSFCGSSESPVDAKVNETYYALWFLERRTTIGSFVPSNFVFFCIGPGRAQGFALRRARGVVIEGYHDSILTRRRSCHQAEKFRRC